MVVTSYEIVIADVKFLQRYHWKYVVVDEGHRLKNFNCKLLRELRTIPTANKLLLTGAVCMPATRGWLIEKRCARANHVGMPACRLLLHDAALAAYQEAHLKHVHAPLAADQTH